MITDERDAAEAFIEELAGRAMPGGAVDAEAAQARGEAAREEAAHAREALRAGGLDPQSLDSLAAERGDARRARVEDARRRAIDASADVGRRLADLTPILPELPDSMNVILDRVTFIRSFADAGVVV
ncbi:MAG TPA: hypothetical protein VFE99_09035, partial [Agromyces sp.]|nr:hypothetical protein [Agromyces sp.]